MKHDNNLLFITGTRADFGKLKPLILGTQDREGFNISVFITGMHLLKAYGSTHLEVELAGVKKTFKYINQHEKSTMDEVLASTITGISNYLKEYEVDAIIIHGDRVEALAGAITGALNNVKVIHIEGGEKSGTIDESIRHAVSKFSHLHFVSSKDAKNRLIQLGEDEDNVFVIGSPNIDIMLSDQLPGIKEVKARYDIEFANYAILIFHPVTTEVDSINQQIEEVLNACCNSGMNFVVIKPNNDLGANAICEQYTKFNAQSKFRLLPSMRFEYYLTLLKHSQCIIGNSSSGICEAPVYGVPTINIGTRQNDRMSSESIFNTSANEKKILTLLLKFKELTRYSMCFENGDGNSLKNFLKIMDTLDLSNIDIQKQFVDLL